MSEQFKSALDVLDKESLNPNELRNLTDELLGLASGVKKAMDKGLTPEEMVPARELLQACQTALEVVKKLSA